MISELLFTISDVLFISKTFYIYIESCSNDNGILTHFAPHTRLACLAQSFLLFKSTSPKMQDASLCLRVYPANLGLALTLTPTKNAS